MASSTEHQVTSTHDQEVDNIELFAVKNDDPVTDGEVKETFTAKDNNKTEAEIKINDKANTILNDKGLFAQIKRDNQVGLRCPYPGYHSSADSTHWHRTTRTTLVSSAAGCARSTLVSGRLLICNHVSLLSSHAFDSVETERRVHDPDYCSAY